MKLKKAKGASCVKGRIGEKRKERKKGKVQLPEKKKKKMNEVNRRKGRDPTKDSQGLEGKDFGKGKKKKTPSLSQRRRASHNKKREKRYFSQRKGWCLYGNGKKDQNG